MINNERLYATFIEICAIDSEPTQEHLLAHFLRDRLLQLGCSVQEDDTGKKIGGSAGNLFARLEGSGLGDPLLLSCHMDRVVPGRGVNPNIVGNFIVSDGTTVLGADDAAGLAAILEGITILRERNILHPVIEIVLTVSEEPGLIGASHFDINCLTANHGFVLDASGRVGEIIVQAPETVKIQAIIHGQSAHAGFEPEKGVSAIQIAGVAISRMKLLRIDPETTANIGSISSIGPSNIVPSRCELLGEIRSIDPVKLLDQIREITDTLEAAAAEYNGKVEVTVVSCYPAYRLSTDAEPVQRAARAAQKIGVSFSFRSTGGGSDANIFNSRGIPSVVLSCGYENAHTTTERMPLDQLALLTEWVVALAAG